MDQLPSPVLPSPAPPRAQGDAGFVSSLARTRGRSPGMRLAGWMSSLWWAAATISTLAIVIAIATWYERDYGQQPVAAHVYDAWWFNAIFVALAINIFGAAAVRYPWRRPQYGFVVVHLGLLTIIAGFACSHDRLDGVLIAKPGVPAHLIELPRDEVAIVDRSRGVFDPLRDAGYPSFAQFCAELVGLAPHVEPAIQRLAKPRPLIDGEVAVRLTRLLDTGADTLGWIPAATNGQPALKIELTARPPSGIEMPLGGAWLDFAASSEQDISQPGAPPVRVAVGRTDSAEAAADFLAPPPIACADGELAVYWCGQRTRVPLTPAALPQTVDVADDLRLIVDLYVLHPRFADGALSDDADAAFDPLLRVRAGVGVGDARRWTNLPVFARMPCYARSAVAEPGAATPTVLFEHPQVYAPRVGSQGLEVQGLLAPDGRLRLRWLRDSRGLVGTATVDRAWNGTIVGGAGDASPMRIDLAATFLPSAERGPEPVRMRADSRDLATRWIEVEVARGAERMRTWLARYSATTVPLPSGDVQLRYQPAAYDLRARHGFTLTLDRFIEGKDPGGMSSASYASEVTLTFVDGSIEHHVITMNEPLRSHGVTLYQSSFEPERDADGETIPGRYRASIFTAATDPGRVLKYIGSALLVGGIVLMYWLRGHRRRPSAGVSTDA